MASHIKILGILHIIFGALGVMAAILVLLIFGGVAGVVGAADASDGKFVAIPILGSIGGIIFLIIMVLSLPGLITGIGLIQFRPWARVLGIVISALDLLSVPFGTALGIYGLWVLLQNQTEPLFRQVAPPLTPTRF